MELQVCTQQDINKLSILLKKLIKTKAQDISLRPVLPVVIKLGKKHLSVDQMKLVTENGKKRLKVEFTLPFESFMEGYGFYDGLETLNDLISKKVTGAEEALTDFQYQIIGSDGGKNLFIRVEGCVKDYLLELEEEHA
jgi:hypothetical protein